MTTLRQIKNLARRAEMTLLQDAAGAAALGAIMIALLHLPALV